MLTYLLSKMKTINVTFEDEEFEALSNRKDSKSWREFILSLIQKDVD